MSIAFADVFPVLAEALPDFKPDNENDGLCYLFLNDMVRWVCDRAYPEFERQMEEFATLFEKLLTEGDSDIRDLTQDALETLWDHEEREVVASHFGPKTQELWKLICKH
jgi:hypothetical protein